MHNKTKIICGTIIVCVFLIGAILINLANNTYNVHFSMDNNTLEAIKSLNYTALASIE